MSCGALIAVCTAGWNYRWMLETSSRTALALQHPWAPLGKQHWSPPVWFMAMMSTRGKPAFATPKFHCCRKKNKLHTDLNRPQGSSKVDPEDVLLYVSANSDSSSIHTACLMFHLHLWLRKLSKRSSVFQNTDPRNPRQSHACVVSQHLKLNTTVISIHNIYSFYQKS